MTSCPKCRLPLEDLAWHCDGCGAELRSDYPVIRKELRRELSKAKAELIGTIVLVLAIIGLLVWMISVGYIYISVPLVFVVFGMIARASRRVSIVREHLTSLDRTHVPLPAARIER